MDSHFFMDFTQRIRSKYLGSVGRFLIRLRISANILTIISLIFGVISVYFLFKDYWLFVLFIALHYTFDSLDGVVARLTKPTKFGYYLDHIGDQLIALLLLAAIYFKINDYFVLIILGLAIITAVIYFSADTKIPVAFVRSPLAITLLFLPLFSWVPIFAYLFAGVVSVYSLALQLKYFLERRLS